MKYRLFTFLWILSIFFSFCFGQRVTIDRNSTEQKAWFSQAALGLHIDFTLSTTAGNASIHYLEKSSKTYQDWYFGEVAGLYSPAGYHPEQIASLARLSGASFVLISVKQADGFCFWNTTTTAFNIMNSAYGKDILKETVDACRKAGLPVGLHYTPADYNFLYKNGLPAERNSPAASPTSNSTLWEYSKRQLAELLTNYGNIALMYIDERGDWGNLLVANHIWNLNPQIMITGGAMAIYENYIPQKDYPAEWIMRYSLKVADRRNSEEFFRTSADVVNTLVEVRSKGGNMLISVSPGPFGDIDSGQDALIRDAGAWIRQNAEALNPVKTWGVAYENGCRFTSSIKENTVYAFCDMRVKSFPEDKAFFFRSIQGNKDARASAPGLFDKTAENPAPLVLSVVPEGVFISITRTRADNREIDLPLVIRLENVSSRPANTVRK